MPSMDLTQTLNNKKTFVHVTDDKNNLLIDQLENEIAEMECEYYFMENTIKTKKPTPINTQDLPIIIIKPPSPMLTINKILLSLFTDN